MNKAHAKDTADGVRQTRSRTSPSESIATLKSKNLLFSRSIALALTREDLNRMIVDSSPEVIPSSPSGSVPDGYWSQEEIEGYFNNY